MRSKYPLLATKDGSTVWMPEGGDDDLVGNTNAEVELVEKQTHTGTMSDVTREEVKARLEASEARVATVVESMRSDAAKMHADASDLRAELREGLAKIYAQGEIAQANADKFYAHAGGILSESRTMLAEIRLAGEQNKTAVLGLGYKAATWIFGALVALGGLYFTIKKAVTPPSAAPPSISAPASPQVPQRPEH